jgi:large subunit ribosomal protein L4
MNNIPVKSINFSSEKIENKNINVPDLLVKSAKSVSYVVRWQLARSRAGTAKTKKMSEISGTTAKPWKQKGTGRARQGSRRSVQFVGGRTCHGPQPRSFDFKMPKKIINKAISDALSNKLIENKLLIFTNFPSKISANKISKILENNKLNKVLFIHNNDNDIINKSVRNIKNVKAIDSKAINVYDIISHDYLIIDDNLIDSKIIKAIK